MRKFKLVILDFDGTLGDSNNLITDTMQAVISQLGLEPRTKAECSKMIGLPLKQCFTHLIPMSSEMGDKCTDLYRKIFAENNIPGAVPPFPGVLETLAQLHREGILLSIASSRYHHSLTEFIEEFGISDIISYVLGADDVDKAKPDPESVLKTLDHFGIDAGEALIVGDTEFDIRMGKNAGTSACGVTYGNGTKEELLAAGADYIIDKFSSLLI